MHVAMCQAWVSDLKDMHESFRELHLKPFLSQVNWLLRLFFNCAILGTTVHLRALTCLDKVPKQEGLVMH